MAVKTCDELLEELRILNRGLQSPGRQFMIDVIESLCSTGNVELIIQQKMFTNCC